MSLEQNSSHSLIVFEIKKIAQLLQKTSVGEFVKSCPFELKFSKSIGQSKWVLILFPNGQYDCNGMSDEQISVYLKMISCEKVSMVLKLDVKFQLRSGIGWKQVQSLCFNNVRARWIGIQLVGVNELSKNDCSDNTAMLSVYLTEHSINSVRYPIYDNIVYYNQFLFRHVYSN